MSFHRTTRQAARFTAMLLAGLSASGSSFGAITVTNANVKPGTGSGVLISYTLNEPATSVQVVLSNGTTLPGGTTKGVNDVAYNGPVAGLSATITATAAAENGAGGAKILLPVTAPSTTNITGVAFFNREGSPYRGELLVAAGFLQGSKYVYRMAGDGTVLKTGDLKAIIGSGSWPFGLAVGQSDAQDRVWVPNRSARVVSVLSPADLTQVASLATTYTYVGTQVTPVRNGTGGVVDNQFNFYVGGNNLGADQGALYHYTADLGAVTPTISTLSVVADDLPTTGTSQSVVVDPTNSVLFKAHLTPLGAAGTQSLSLAKWTSTDGGATWIEDIAWGTQITTSIGIADGTPYGVAFDKGFDASNLANSYVWAAIAGGAANANKIFRVNAATGNVDTSATIDLTQVDVPSGGLSIGDKALRYIGTDYNGNIAVVLQGGTGTYSNVAGSHYAVLAPNTAAPTTASLTLPSVEPPLSGVATTDNERVGNTGNATVHYSVDVFDRAGIVADNVQVKADLSAIGGAAAAPLTRGTVSADGKSATYTTSFKTPTTAALGTFNLPFTITANSGSAVTRVAQTIYQAYVPTWTAAVSGAVTGTATNGPTTWAATDAGNVYAFNSKTGVADPNFGGGSGVSVGEAVSNRIVAARGRLYVPGATRLFILDLGSGAPVGSAAIPQPSAVALHPTDPTTIFVGGGDNKVHALNAETGAQKYASADLGGAVNDPTVGVSYGTASLLMLAAGTSPASGAGSIVMLDPADLTQAFPAIADAKGAVRSRPAFSLRGDGLVNMFAIGGASGLWAVNADDGTLFPWPTDSTHGGNPFATAAPVDADPAITATPAGDPRIVFADTLGNFYVILSGDGGKLSFGGVPAGLTTPPGTGGIADGAGVLLSGGPSAADGSTALRIAYLGSDANDRRFFAFNTLPDDSTFGLTPQSLRTFDPNDSATFPGEAPGGFSNRPTSAGESIITGSSAGRVYGFPSLVKPLPYIQSVTPANGAKGVSANQAVSATFSAPVLPGGTASVQLYQNGAPVSGFGEFGLDGVTVSFTPSAPLTTQKSYTFVVEGATDAGNNAPLPAFSSTFYVGVPPSVQGDVDGNGVFDLNDVREALRMAGGLKATTAQAMTATGNKATPDTMTLEDAIFLGRVLSGKATF